LQSPVVAAMSRAWSRRSAGATVPSRARVAQSLVSASLLVLAAVKAAQLWFKAAFNPYWPN
jgi:hypothetical protein